MSNLNQHVKSDKVKWIITGIALVLILAILGGILAAVLTETNPKDWFEQPAGEETETSDEETPANTENGGAVIGAPVENGIKLMSAKIPVAEFAANGVSAQAETAYTLTATIVPDTATDKTVDWEIAFVNPSSEWATDKVVTNYVTVTPTADGALTANVECLQAFGEQIVVTVVSRDNPLATATCTIDYAQKVTGVTLKFGDVSVNFGGTTDMKWQVNVNGKGFGGATDFEYEVSDVYTLEDTFSYKVELFAPPLANGDPNYGLKFGGHTWMSSLIRTGEIISDITESGLLLDRAYLNSFDFWYDTRQGGTHLNNLSASDFQQCTSTIELLKPFLVKVSVEGAYGSFNYSSDINITEFVNSASVTGISLGNSSLVF